MEALRCRRIRPTSQTNQGERRARRSRPPGRPTASTGATHAPRTARSQEKSCRRCLLIGRDVDCSVKRRSFSAAKAPIAPDLAGSLGAGRLRPVHDFIGLDLSSRSARPGANDARRGRRRGIPEILSPLVRLGVLTAPPRGRGQRCPSRSARCSEAGIGCRTPKPWLMTRWASWVRDVTPSFRNTLRRWYSTVLGVTNSWAAISRFACPRLTRAAICASWG